MPILSRHEIIHVLQRRGFSEVDGGRREYAESWQRQNERVNIKSGGRNPLVIHPRHESRVADFQHIQGVVAGVRPYYHSTALSGFPKRINTGMQEIRYGIDFGFESETALAAFLDILTGQCTAPVFDDNAQVFLEYFMDPGNPQFSDWLPRYTQTLYKVREALQESAPEKIFELLWKTRDNSVSDAGRGIIGFDVADRLRDRLIEAIQNIADDGTPASFAAMLRRFESWREAGELRKVPELMVARAFAAIHPEIYPTAVDSAKLNRVIPWFAAHTGFSAPDGNWAARAAALSAHLARSGVFGDSLEKRNMFPWFVFQQVPDASGGVPFRPGFSAKPVLPGTAHYPEQVRSLDYAHKAIERRLVEMLCELYGKDVIGSEHPTGTGGRADFVVYRQGRYQLYEIKPAATAASAVRQAMGQLLEYAYRKGGLEPVSLHVVSNAMLDNVTADFLGRLKDEFDLPIDYIHVAIDNFSNASIAPFGQELA